MKSKICNSKGQGLIEYLIIVAIMAIGSLAIMRVMGHNIEIQFAKITQQLTGDRHQNVHVERVEAGHFKKRDMQNFIEGATN